MMNLKVLFLALAVLTTPFLRASLGHALTLGAIKTEIRRAIRDNPSDTSRQRYGDSVLEDLVNQGQREMTIIGDLADKTSVYVLTARTSYYALPADLVAVKQVYFSDRSNQLRELEEQAQKSLYDNNPHWERTGGIPISYWVSQATNPQNQASAPLRISYIPIPTNLSTGTVTIWYSYLMPDLDLDSDVPFENRRNLYAYHYALVYYVVMRIKLIENKTTEASAYQGLYATSISTMKGKLGEMPNYTPGSSIPRIRGN